MPDAEPKPPADTEGEVPLHQIVDALFPQPETLVEYLHRKLRVPLLMIVSALAGGTFVESGHRNDRQEIVRQAEELMDKFATIAESIDSTDELFNALLNDNDLPHRKMQRLEMYEKVLQNQWADLRKLPDCTTSKLLNERLKNLTMEIIEAARILQDKIEREGHPVTQTEKKVA